MPRFAKLQQPESTRDAIARDARPRRARGEERQPQRAATGSNQRALRKRRAQQAQEAEAATPDSEAQAGEIATLLRHDADDASGQARARIESLPENERAEVTERLQTQMSESDLQRAAPTLARPAPHVVQPQTGEPAQKKEEAPRTEEARANEPDALVDEEIAEQVEEERAESGEESGEQTNEKEAGAKDEARKKRKRGDGRAGGDATREVAKAAALPPQSETGSATGDVSVDTAPSVAAAAGAVESGPAASEGTQAPPAAAGAPSGPAEESAAKVPEAMAAPAGARTAAQTRGGGPAPAPAAFAGGGGGGGGAASMDEAPPESAEAEETEEKMAAAEPETDDTGSAEPEPRDDELSADKAMEDAENAPPSEVEEQAKAAEEEEAAARSGGGEAAAPEEEEEADAPPAGQVELPAEEREAALGSIGEEVSGGGEGGGAAGGGGGGAAAEEATAEEPPDVSSAPPAAAMATVSSLKVGQIAGAIAGVSASVSGKVTKEKDDLVANAPSMERPSGAPQTKESRERADGGGEGSAVEGIEEVAAEGETPSAEEQLTPLEDPGPAPTAQVAAPRVSGGGEGGTMSAADVENLESAIETLPTSDPALEETAGPPPTVALVGEADPAVAEEQRTQLEETTANLEAEGSEEAARPLGEDEIYPVVPEETLTATIEGNAGGGEGASVAVDDETAAIVAEEEEGDSVRAEASAAQAEMTAAESDHANEVATKNAEHETAVEEAVAANEEQQTARRTAAKSEVVAKRGEWTSEQRAMVDQSRGDADAAMAESNATVEREQTSADERAAQEIEHGNEEAAAARKDAERDAKKEKESADAESGGFFDWVASAATSFFNGLKAAIGAIFDAARALVKGAIELAQKAAAAIIDAARDAIIAGIRLAGEACMLAADFLLAGFPELRDRVKGAIQETVSAAEDAVNELADNLKRGVQELLDALGKALDAALSLLEKGLMAAVDAVAAAVEGAIKAAKAAIAALALFAALIKDIAADPAGWISNLGAAMLDGIQNHLWKELKAAVKAWFNAKLDSVLGIGTAIWDVLKKGKITVAQVGKMAFEALKAAIPMMLIQLIVEKVASMIVPAFGAVMVIVESLQAAWGAISAIITAIGKFIDFLKAVRGGNAGPQFAQALAAGAVAVIEFVSSFLVVKLIGPAKKVGGKVKAMAGRIMAKLKALGQKIARAAKKVIGKIKKAIKKVGKKLGFGKKKKSRTKKDKEKAEARLEKAMREIPPRLDSSASNGAARALLTAKLMYFRARYRLSDLRLIDSSENVDLYAAVNPNKKERKYWRPPAEWLRKQVRTVTDELLNHPSVMQKASEMSQQEGSEDDPIRVGGKGAFPALVRNYRRKRNPRDPFSEKGEQRHYDVKNRDAADSTRVIESAGGYGSKGIGGTNAVVEQIGDRPLGASGAAYPSLPGDIATIASDLGISQADVLSAIRAVARNEPVAPALHAKVAPMTFLLFGREAIRNPQALVHSAMTMDLLAADKISMNTAFNREARGKAGTGGGLLPMSMVGGPAAARELEREQTEGRDPAKRSFAARRMAEREAEVVRRWLMAEFGTKNLTWPIAEKSAAQQRIRRAIRSKMMKFFDLE